MAKEYDDKKYLKDKKKKKDLLEPILPEGKMLKPDTLEGRPLWVDDKLNEEKKKKKKLNEEKI